MPVPVFTPITFAAEDDPYDNGEGYNEKLAALAENFLLLANYNRTIELAVELGLSGFAPQGGWDASGNVYPAPVANGSWIVTVPGTLGGDAMVKGDFFVYTGAEFVNRKILTSELEGDPSPSLGGTLNPNGHAINEQWVEVYSAANVVTIDASSGNKFTHTLTENTELTFINLPAAGTGYSCDLVIIQDAGASGFTFDLPAGSQFHAGELPILTATASAKDKVVIDTTDAGASYIVLVAGQGIA